MSPSIEKALNSLPSKDGLACAPEEYNCLALSTGHLSGRDHDDLTEASRKRSMVMERDTGYFVKLYSDIENNVRPHFSDDLNLILVWACKQGYRLIEFDEDADECGIFKFWC